MQKYKRPPIPQDFETAVADARKKISDHFKRRKRNTAAGSAGPRTEEEKIEFDAKWGKYKDVFAEAQGGKCGYCEMMVIGNQDGDVEHFFPKGEIWQLDDRDPDSWGKERDWASSVADRKRPVISSRGYWWLAYEWSNYLLSCAVCNQKWKLSFFPVGNTPRKLPPTKRSKEQALLLNPFDEAVDPTLHLKFGSLGEVEARDSSPYGFETIRTCGLDRVSLRRAREEKAERAFLLLIDLDEAIRNRQRDAEQKHYQDFYRLGKEHRVHSGMVRIIFEQGTGMKWEDLVRLVEGP